MHSLESPERDDNGDLRSNIDEALAAVVLAILVIPLLEDRATWKQSGKKQSPPPPSPPVGIRVCLFFVLSQSCKQQIQF
nr:unnamed protein product [Spirometra erinaceieuropaei]